MTTITLNTPIVRTTIATEVEITQVRDFPNDKKVYADIITAHGALTLCLWAGSDYNAAGQWTDSDVASVVKTRIANYYNGIYYTEVTQE